MTNACPHPPHIGVNPRVSRTARRRVITYDCPCGKRGIVLDTEPTAYRRQRNTYVDGHGGGRGSGVGSSVLMVPTVSRP